MNRELEAMLMNASSLPTIPVVAAKVMKLIEDENISVVEIVRVVEADPAVAACVLKIANSAFYGYQREIHTLPHAIMVLGFSTLKSLIVAASLKQVYKPYGLTEKMLWEHSFGAGLAARIIAREAYQVNVEEAFLGGLFHDIGKSIMNFNDARRFLSVMQMSYNNKVSFEEAERQVYPYTHSEVGALVIQKWNFPEILTHAVRRHHSIHIDEDEDPVQARLTCVVALANLFCHKAGIGVREPAEGLELLQTFPAQFLALDQKALDSLLERFITIFEQDSSFF